MVARFLPLLLALLFYVPTYWDMAQGLWRLEEHSHGPLILLVVVWLFWRGRAACLWCTKPARFAGGFFLVLGLLAHVLGRALSIPLLELGSQLPVLAGILLYTGGWQLLRHFRFALGFLLFMLPLPGSLVDTITAPLKLWIAVRAEELLYFAGYPVARSGVVLSLSQYRLLVADACSGLYSMIFLGALGLLYVHLAERTRRLHNALLLAAILPVALLANLMRVLFIVLVTYHWGDGVGQGPLHEMAGLGVFVLALLLLVALDTLLLKLLPVDQGTLALALAPRPPLAPSNAPSAWLLASLSVVLLGAAAGAELVRPGVRQAEEVPPLLLEAAVPTQFGPWRLVSEAAPIRADVQRAGEGGPYEQILGRSYVNTQGQRVMLSIAYGANQLSDRFQAHRPEYCYQAQGFALQHLGDSQVSVPGKGLMLRNLLAVRPGRSEPISYWMVLGQEAVLPGLERKWSQFRQGLAGRVPDGYLVRVSSIGEDAALAHELHSRFIQDLLNAVGNETRTRLAGWTGMQEGRSL